MAGLAASAAAGVPIIVDLTTDPEQIPPGHPNYDSLGLGTSDTARAFTSMLLLANLITVPSKTLMMTLENSGYPAMVISNGWSKKNKNWSSKVQPHKELNLGWIGTSVQLEDVAEIRRMVIRVLREFRDIQLNIIGDYSVYQLFDNIPRSRRRYIPLPPNEEELPRILDQIDLLIHPLRNTPFNRSLSDDLLMKAGVKRIPWIASSLPAAVNWKAGGIIVHNTNEWLNALHTLIIDKELRHHLGRSGYKQAQTREISHLKQNWLEAIRFVV
jgi:glycosyltransferase involved in cell wall biosynthesis